MKGMRSILVATDLTAASDEVMRTAGALAALTGAKLHVLHAYEFTPPPYADEAASRVTKTFPERLAEAKRALEDQIRRTVRPGVEVGSGEIEIYIAFKAILARAREVDAELIVLGRHRRRKRADAFLGSTADRVVRSAEVPCLIVHDPLRLPLRRVVAPIDLSAPARGALEVALAWSASLGPTAGDQRRAARVIALHVIPRVFDYADLPFDRAVAAPALHQEVERARREVDDEPAPNVREEVRWGDSPTESILRLAEEEDADLVVLGTHGYGAVRRVLIGSVASGVARAARCPVLLVPPASWAPEPAEGTKAPSPA